MHLSGPENREVADGQSEKDLQSAFLQIFRGSRNRMHSCAALKLAGLTLAGMWDIKGLT